ncbi:hypothetical protein GQ43DRAFT_15293 [Delitschia confertaspora ATCC 74209]|uniref:Uncharacterized protein n=1 Tax=Delitschia confertaspora ATCC 74209 TaxID=1513339 RepID=A0A9P4JY80_9PLEO|nr:hypothetical protein GQ43DRAFT_15293 [Delitschia confertaspora ATCC 74209]
MKSSNSSKESDGSVEAQSEVQAQNDRLVARNKEIMMALQELELQHDEKTSLLKAALLNRDNLPPGLLELRRAETLKRVRAHIERAAAAGDDEKTKVVEDATTAITEEIVESQAAVEMAKKDLLEQQTLNETLKEEVERAKVEDGNKGSEELQKENENLRRELRLMTTAWYDMTCRLQSNTVVLQRRDSPKSWLGRQRAVVGGNGAPIV